MRPEIKIDTRAAIAKFSDRGIPEQVRTNLRRLLPPLIKSIGRDVDKKLDTELKSRRRLKTQMLMREDPNRITGQLSVVWTGDKTKAMVPQWLETGTRAHWIEAKFAKSLYFFWPKAGGYVSFKRVYHPGFAGINYMERTMEERQTDIVETITRATRTG